MAIDSALRQNILQAVRGNIEYRKNNHKIIDVYDGNLTPHLNRHLSNIFSPTTFDELRKFTVPINVLQRIIDKLTKIYQQTVVRNVLDGTDQDSELLSWYERNLCINQAMNLANEFFNLTKITLLEPYLSNGIPKLRPIPSDRFFPMSLSKTDPTKMDLLNIILKSGVDENNEEEIVILTWTDQEFLIWDNKNRVRKDLMKFYGNMSGDGVNPFGRIPYTYINKSLTKLLPTQDTDVMGMTLEIPSQLSFLSFAIGYNSFPIIIAKNVDEAKLKRSPNIVWFLSKNPNSDAEPEVTTIKPEVDISESLQFIQSEFALWLNSKGIRPGSIGALDKDQFSSGISKIVDESDTSESRKAQVQYFKKAEENDLWDLVLNHMHPFWSENNLIENKSMFTPNAKVEVIFAEQKPMLTRAEQMRALREEVEAGFTTMKRALKSLNPEMSAKDIDELLAEVSEDKTIKVIQETTNNNEEVADISK